MEVDITPVVAILIGLGLRAAWPVPGLNLTGPLPLRSVPPAGVSVPPVDIALGDRPIILLQKGIKAGLILSNTSSFWVKLLFFFHKNTQIFHNYGISR